MGAAQHKNRASSLLAAGITSGSTTLTVTAGQGARFPALAAGQNFGIVIQTNDQEASTREYCLCTARAGDVLTITRAQDGSAAQAFNAGDTVAHVVLARELDLFVQKDSDALTGPLNFAPRVSVAVSAGTVDLATALSNTVVVTGGGSITSLGVLPIGAIRYLTFASPSRLVNGANLISLTSANLDLEIGDCVVVEVTAASTWKVISYMPQNGIGKRIQSKVLSRSKFINSGWFFNQRGSGSVSSNGSRPVDSWKVESSYVPATISAQQVTSESLSRNNSRYAMKFDVAATGTAGASDFWLFTGYVEGLDFMDVMWGTSFAMPVTISFNVFCTVAGTHYLSIRNSAAGRSYLAPFTINSANTWEQKIITIPGDTGGAGTWLRDTGVGVRVSVCLDAGSTFTNASASAWLAGNYLQGPGATNFRATARQMYLENMQLEFGSDYSAFDFQSLASAGTDIRRYIQSVEWYAVGVTYKPNGDTRGASVPFPVTMRATPTQISYTGQLNLLSVGNGGDATNTLHDPSISYSQNSLRIYGMNNLGSLGGGSVSAWGSSTTSTALVSAEF